MTRSHRLLPILLAILAVSVSPACKGPAGDAKPAPSGGGAGTLEVVPATGPQIVARIRADGAPVTLVNVWATWCPPCREEMPDILRLYRAYHDRGLDLVLVSADFDDQAAQARTFLHERGVDFTTYIKSGDDAAFINAFDPKWSGALPASFVYGRDGTLRTFREGKATYAQLEESILAVLNGKGKGA